jgi:hypothetical protein
MKRFAVLSVGVLLAFGISALGRTLDYKAKDGFSITIPDDWDVIPEAQVAEVAENARKSAPNAPVPDFRYGFQAKAEKWFQYPYVVVAPSTKGRTSEAALNKLGSVDVAKSSSQLKETLSKLASDIQVGKMVYDPQTHTVWGTTDSVYPGVGKVRCLTGAVETEQGAIWVYCYAPADVYDKYNQVFANIISSVQLRDDLVYKPRASEALSADEIARRLGRVTGVMIGVAVLLYLMRKVARR